MERLYLHTTFVRKEQLMATNTTRKVYVNLRTRSNCIPALLQPNLAYNADDYMPCQCLKTLHVIGPDNRPVAAASKA